MMMSMNIRLSTCSLTDLYASRGKTRDRRSLHSTQRTTKYSTGLRSQDSFQILFSIKQIDNIVDEPDGL